MDKISNLHSTIWTYATKDTTSMIITGIIAVVVVVLILWFIITLYGKLCTFFCSCKKANQFGNMRFMGAASAGGDSAIGNDGMSYKVKGIQIPYPPTHSSESDDINEITSMLSATSVGNGKNSKDIINKAERKIVGISSC